MKHTYKFSIMALLTAGALLILWTFMPHFTGSDKKQVPKQGGIYRIPIKREVITLDPREVVWIHEKVAMQLVFDPLIRLTSEYQLEPALCQEWELSRDNKRFTCTLRQDVYFHDGRKMSGEDVMGSLHYILGPGGLDLDEFEDVVGIKEYWSGDAPRISGIKISNDRDLVIELEKPVPMFSYHLATTRIVIIPGNVARGSQGPFFLDPIGTGPFRYQMCDRGRWVFSRFDDYYDGAPYLDRIELVPMSFTEAVDSLKAGAAHDMRFFELTASAAPITHADHIVAVPSKTKANVILFPNNSKPPFDDENMRELLYSLVDKKSTLLKCGQRDGYTDSLVPSGVTGYVYRDMGTKYNYGRAVDLIRSMRKSGIDIPAAMLYYIPGEVNDCIVRAANDNFVSASVPWRFVAVSQKKLAKLFFEGKTDAHIETLEIKNADAFTILKYFMSSNRENLPQIHDERIDALMKLVGVTGDLRRRSELYRQVNERIIDRAFALPLLEARNVILYNDRVRTASDSLDERNFIKYSKVWLQ
jgi:ABC-type transport system substrate-binding protein